MSTGRHHLEALRRSIFLGIGALLTLTLPACASSSFDIADEDTCTASNCSDSSSTQESFTETNLETGGPSGSTDGSSLYACASPRSIISWTTQKPTGFIECIDGSINRITSIVPKHISAGSCTLGTPIPDGSTQCREDSDCPAHSVCDQTRFPQAGEPESAGECGCRAYCNSDADCAPDEACLTPNIHGDERSTCYKAECRTDADCASWECGWNEFHDGCSTHERLACRNAATEPDECRSDADCAINESCLAVPGSNWVCQTSDCDLDGRPFRVDGQNRVADAMAREDWCAPVDIEPLPCLNREHIGQAWLDNAAGEHASVASFARFALELMAHGAPAELLSKTAQAMADEVQHASAAYALASHFLQTPMGPDRLNMRDAVEVGTRRDMIASLIHEACVGETIAVARACAALEQTEHDAIRTVLQKIVDDEIQHAALGWSCLQWALRDQDAATLEFARDCFADAISQHLVSSNIADSDEQELDLRKYGILPRAEAKLAAHDAVQAVILPAIQQLFAAADIEENASLHGIH